MSDKKFHINPLVPEDYWRAVILQGKNTASYKFALAQSLLDLAPQQGQVIKLEDLAPIYAHHLVEHIREAPKQSTGKSGKLLQACQDFDAEKITETQLVEVTQKEGFKYVLDAFHVVGNQPIEQPFFVKSTTTKAIEVTEHFDVLRHSPQRDNLHQELQSRWRLVETAWSMNIAQHLIGVQYDTQSHQLYILSDKQFRRKNITSSRGALNGYQLGRCFYCFDAIQLTENTDVDHFFPHMLQKIWAEARQYHLDGIWNLVLACEKCNRGAEGKFALLPDIELLHRLDKRNEHLICSHHPLRETLILQTGKTASARRAFLQRIYQQAKAKLIHTWKPKIVRDRPYF